MRSEAEKEGRRAKEAQKLEEYKKYYVTHPEEIQQCRKCRGQKPLKEFISHWSFRTICKICHKGNVHGWRNGNAKANQESSQRSFEKSANFIKSLKNDPCGECGNKYPPCVMDFHHTGVKTSSISRLYQKSKERILAEVDQCALICANCHREETHRNRLEIPTSGNRTKAADIVEIEVEDGCTLQFCAMCKQEKNELNFTFLATGYRHSYCKKCLRQYNRGLKRTPKEGESDVLIKELKTNSPCKDCGHKYNYWIMDLDHVGPLKLKNLNRLRGWNVETVREELKKCEVVCANCHRLRTIERKKTLGACKCGYKHKSEHDKAEHNQVCDFQVQPVNLKLVEMTRTYDAGQVRQLLKEHYAGYGRSAVASYFAGVDGNVMAAVKIAPVVRTEVATSMGLDPSNVLELDRLYIKPEFQVHNMASKVLGLVVRRIRVDFPEVQVLVSFADLEQGHIGSVYRAAGWVYVGATAPSYVYADEKGQKTNKKVIYNRAIRDDLTEKEYAIKYQLEKVVIKPKLKFVMNLKS